MTNQKLLLGIDVSTTGAKALLINTSGRVISSATSALELSTPHPLWSEQDPEDWWEGIKLSIKKALTQANANGDDITAIGMTGQMHGLVLLDANGKVLRPAILEFAVDRAGGSGTILFDLAKRTWSEELINTLEIPNAWLPPTFEGPEVTGAVTKNAADDTSLSEGIPVFGGGGDQAAQAIGVGAVQPGIIALTLGTSGVVFATTESPLVEPEGRLHAFCHAVPERWHFMGVMLSAAGSLQWYRDTLAPDTSFDELISEAISISPGSEGLLFLPYLTGERTPHPDPEARGAWVGLTVRHTRAHLTRAVLEGVAFGIKDSFTLIQTAGLGEITQVRISGGGAKSQVWQQIMADVLGSELVTVNTTEGAAFGAALLAGVGVGAYDSVHEACEATIQITGKTPPDDRISQIYNDYHVRYQALYPILEPEFKQIAKVAT